MSEKDKANLLNILDSCNKVASFAAGLSNADDFYEDLKSFDAVLMNFIIIGEAVGRLSFDFKHENSHVPWIQIKQFRNIVAHDYFGVDAEEVWQIVQNHIPKLKTDVINILN